ncbi:LysR substrate-binding domain-containing protein [Ruegeria atlantica]|uniref:LysR substrate-binding domain-containing protein n=1 Tax=Ruegeria atlantica TaxID=81569 RepID=UPI0009EBB041|nr:LysR substrate-binding domain-containing protein [Ruegeria atlantica]
MFDAEPERLHSLDKDFLGTGHGVVLKSELDVGDDVRSGRLVSVLRDFPPPPKPLQMMFPPSRAQPRRVTALAEHLRRKFGVS